jgi:hypothetical protein
MARGRKRRARPQRTEAVVEPASVVDGIPDRSRAPRWWKYALLAAILLGWIAALVYCGLAGAP